MNKRTILIYEKWEHFIPTGLSWSSGLLANEQSVIHIDPPDPLINYDLSNVDIIFYDGLEYNGDLDSAYLDIVKVKDNYPNIKIFPIVVHPKEFFLKYHTYIDKFLTTIDSYTSSDLKFKEMGFDIIHVPLAADTELFYKTNDEYKFDYSFIGTISHGYRREDKYLYPFIDNNDLIGVVAGVTRPGLCKQYVTHNDLNMIYNSTKINLNFHYDIQKGIDTRYDLNGRVFEIALSGNFQLCDNHPYVTILFGNSIPTVNAENFKDSFYYYLSHEDERFELAEKSRKICLEEHTWKKRMSDLLEKI